MAGAVTTMSPVQAGIPVIDGTNLSQNIMTAIEVGGADAQAN
jgi:conjugal transfer/entry exclusion protein